MQAENKMSMKFLLIGAVVLVVAVKGKFGSEYIFLIHVFIKNYVIIEFSVFTLFHRFLLSNYICDHEFLVESHQPPTFFLW